MNGAGCLALADLRSALGKKRKDGKSAPVKRLTKMQRVYVSRLITKHGDNYEVMLSVCCCFHHMPQYVLFHS